MAALSLDYQDQPFFLKHILVSGFMCDAIGKWAKATLTPSLRGHQRRLLGCFAAITIAGCTHQAVVVSDRKHRDRPQFLWMNTVLGNLETTLAGAYHSLSYCKCTNHYLAAFGYRFDRRSDLRGLVSRLIVNVARCAPIREQLVGQLAKADF